MEEKLIEYQERFNESVGQVNCALNTVQGIVG